MGPPDVCPGGPSRRCKRSSGIFLTGTANCTSSGLPHGVEVHYHFWAKGYKGRPEVSRLGGPHPKSKLEVYVGRTVTVVKH